METKKIVKKTELTIEKIKEVIGEDPLITSGLKFDKELYKKKVEVLKEMLILKRLVLVKKNEHRDYSLRFRQLLNWRYLLLELPF